MKNVFMILAFIIFSYSFCFASNEIVKVADVKGMAIIKDDNIIAARKEAIRDAEINALEQICGIHISEKVTAENFEITNQKIETYTSGYIKSAKELENSAKIENQFGVMVLIITLEVEIEIGVDNTKYINEDFRVENDTLIEYTGKSEEITIPYGIKHIGISVFRDNKTLKKVTIPGYVKSISTNAFLNCTNLEEIVLENGTTLIGESAFTCFDDTPNTKLKSLYIPGSVKEISDYAFSNYSALEYIEIENGVNSIGRQAFSCTLNNPNLSLKTLTIPGSVDKIGDYSFFFHSNLENLILEKGIKEIGICAFGCGDKYLNNKLKKLNIPNSVTSINHGAFLGCCCFEKIIFNEGIKNIGESSFDGSVANQTLTELIIPGSVENIGNYAFPNYIGLENLIFNDGIKYIGKSSFGNMGSNINYQLAEIVIPKSVEYIGEFAFSGYSRLEKIVINEGIKYIKMGAFINPNNYQNKVLTDLIIPNSVKYIESGAFYGFEALTRLTLGNSLEEIGSYAFACENQNVYMKELTIPDSIKNMGEGVFANHENLKKINSSFEFTEDDIEYFFPNRPNPLPTN